MFQNFRQTKTPKVIFVTKKKTSHKKIKIAPRHRGALWAPARDPHGSESLWAPARGPWVPGPLGPLGPLKSRVNNCSLIPKNSIHS